MKIAWLAAGLFVLTPLAASAVESNNSAIPSLYTCEGSGFSRVALKADPAPCCNGRLRCAQLLSTQTILSRKHPNRT